MSATQSSAALAPWLLYGASGYTGTLLAEEACRRGLTPVLAGRSAERVAPLARRLGLAARAFPLDEPARIARELAPFAAVLLAAGPFERTSAPVLSACLASGKHYLDITGELAVFEAARARDAAARAAGAIVMPGVGFDVVPSDCLALALREALPGAVRLELAFHAPGGASRGTLKTVAQNLHRGGAVRRGGALVLVPLAWRERSVPFRDRARNAMSIPWGDVSTAWHTTGIGDIVVYQSASPQAVARLRRLRPLLRLGALGPIQWLLARLIERRPSGPDADTRERARCELWGRVEDAAGRALEGTLTTPEGYRLTATTGIEALRRVLAEPPPPGYHTPGSAFGSAFVRGFEGCELVLGAPG